MVFLSLSAAIIVFLSVFSYTAKPTSKTVALSKKNAKFAASKNLKPIASSARPSTLIDGNQTRQIGLPSLAQYPSSPISGVDNINTFLGQVDIKIPLLTVSGRGKVSTSLVAPIYQEWSVLETYWEYGANYTYDPMYNKRFDPIYSSSSTGTSSFSPGYGPGVMNFKRIWMPVDQYSAEMLTSLSFETADGGSIQLYDKSTYGKPVWQGWGGCGGGICGFGRGTEFVSTDGSGVTFISDNAIHDVNDYTYGDPTTGTRQPSGYLIFKDGTRYRIYHSRVLWQRDANGNRIDFSYDSSGRVTSITDSLKRTVTVEYNIQDVSPYGLCDRINYTDFDGNTKTIRVSRTNLSNVLFQGNTIKNYGQLFPGYPFSSFYDTLIFNPTVISAVWLPNNFSYKFYYNSYGEVARLELPTKGAFEYSYAHADTNYSAYRRVTEKRIFSDQNTLVSKMTVGQFIAVPTGNPIFDGYQGYVIVDQCNTTSCSPNEGLINRTKHYFYGDAITAKSGLDLSLDSFYSGWSSGKEFRTESLSSDGQTLLVSTETTWQPRTPLGWWRAQHPVPNPYFWEPNIDNRATSVKTTLHDVSPNLIKLETYSYDDSVPFNNLSDTYEYDYGSGTYGNLLRRTHTDYLTSSTYTDTSVHLRSLPSQQWVSSDAVGNNKVSLVQYEYDNYTPDSIHAALVDRTNITNLCITTDDNGNCVTPSSLGYTTRGNVTKVTKFANAATATEPVSAATQYDIAGNVVKVFDARSIASGQQTGQYFFTTIDYADRFGTPDGEARTNSAPGQLAGQFTYAFATSTTNPLGHTAYVQFNYLTGKPVDGEDIRGTVNTSFYNDVLGRQTQVIIANNRPTLRSQTSIAYDDNNRIVTVTGDLRIYGDNILKSETFYDGLGRTIKSHSYENASSYIVSEQKYDALGRVYQTSNPYRPSVGEQAIWTTTTYDALSRVKIIETPDGAQLLKNYSGNVTTVTDQAGKKRRGVTDALGRVTKVIEDPNGQLNYESTYTFDAVNNLRMTVQGEQKRYFLYDSLGRLIRSKIPEQDANATLNMASDALTENNSQWSAGFTYDANSNMLTKIDARNTTTTLTYDELNRAKTRAYSDGTPPITITYDSPTVPNSKGLPTSISSNVSTYNYTAYDELGGIVSSSQTTNVAAIGQPENNVTYTMSYSYDLAGNLVSETYPSGRVVTNTLDDAGRLKKLTSQETNQPARTYFSDPSYTSHGAIESLRLGNGRWENYQFNSRQQITVIGVGASIGSTSLLKIEYGYGGSTANNGSLLQQTITVPNMSNQMVQTYTYDELNRLKSSRETSGGTQNWVQTFNYDRYGNRTTDTDVTKTTSSLVGPNPDISTAKNRIVPRQSELYEYDANGNLIKDKTGNTFVYDADNMQTKYNGGASQNGADYFYDASGKRVKKIVGNVITIFVYDASGKLVAEYQTNYQPGTTRTSYLTSDTLASPRIITDGRGIVVSRHDYIAFGEELYAGMGGRSENQKYSTNDNIRQKFTGYERDNESGLDYAQARYYSSQHGRFTSVDPLTASATIRNPQTFNRYTYALNNPHKFVDPLGLANVCVAGGCTQTPEDEARIKAQEEAAQRNQENSQKQENSCPKKGYCLEYKMVEEVMAKGEELTVDGENLGPQFGKIRVSQIVVYKDGEEVTADNVEVKETVKQGPITEIGKNGKRVPASEDFKEQVKENSIDSGERRYQANLKPVDFQGIPAGSQEKFDSMRKNDIQSTRTVTFTVLVDGKEVGSRTITSTTSVTSVKITQGPYKPTPIRKN